MQATKESQESALKAETFPCSADRVMITYYTDPLCCWSWALEPHWQRLKSEYSGRIDWRYVMGGMIQDWETYNDPMNAITRPLQFGPIWMHASQVSGVSMDWSIWHKDPPASSFPACIAVKCATLQSLAAGETLLYSLREAVMSEGLNVSRETVIMSIAKALANDGDKILDYDRFVRAWADGSGVSAFRNDLQQTRFLKIGRYPTLTFTGEASKGIIITGYRPFDVLKEALDHMFEQTRKKQNPS
jgi:putative protein-disulfide isomerase